GGRRGGELRGLGPGAARDSGARPLPGSAQPEGDRTVADERRPPATRRATYEVHPALRRKCAIRGEENGAGQKTGHSSFHAKKDECPHACSARRLLAGGVFVGVAIAPRPPGGGCPAGGGGRGGGGGAGRGRARSRGGEPA